MYRFPAALVSILALSSACADFDPANPGGTERPVVADTIGEPRIANMPRGRYMVVAPELAPPPTELAHEPDAAYAANYIFYMNRSGGTYTPGINDSRQNRSSVPQQTATIPAWNVSDHDWAEIMSCVRAQFAAYSVEITDVDPGNVPHIESVVAGRPENLALDPRVGGVSPFAQDCSVINNSIVFTFAEVFQGNNRVVCEVIAQEVAHSFGLDHQYLCEDPMTYLSGCGAKSFQDTDAQCGEDAPRTCYCGQKTQNSVAMLSARLGPADPDTVQPTVDITSPRDGQTVAPGFNVTVAAVDDIAVQQVELYVDGIMVAIDTSDPFSFATDPNLAPGTHVIETIARDGQNQSSMSIAITVDPNAGDPNNPNDPNDPSDPSSPSSPEYITGGCSTGGSGSGSAAALMLLGLALVLRRRRL